MKHRDMHSLIMQRLGHKSWNVSLKALLVVRRIALDGDETFLETFADSLHHVRMERFRVSKAGLHERGLPWRRWWCVCVPLIRRHAFLL